MRSEWNAMSANRRNGALANTWHAALALCALFGLPVAHAGSTADDLAQIEAEHVVAKARLRLVETQAQIAARRADIERQAPLIQAGMPTVAGIEGMADHLWATLQLENGVMAEVKVGDTLPNGMRVASIAPAGVVVRTASNRRVRLQPSGEAQVNQSAAFGQRVVVPTPSYPVPPPAVMSLPPLPPPQAVPPVATPRMQATPGSGQ